MLGTILIILYVVACLFLVLVVLLQAGKGGGLGAAFGGGGAGSVFGGRGAATFLTKLTGFMAALFMVLSVGISLNMGKNRSSVDPDAAIEEEEEEDLSSIGEDSDEAAKEGGKDTPAPFVLPGAKDKKDEAAKPAPAERPTEEKPAEPAAEEKPAEAAAEEKPAEPAAEEKPAEAAPAEAAPAEAAPAEPAPAEPAPAEAAPTG